MDTRKVAAERATVPKRAKKALAGNQPVEKQVTASFVLHRADKDLLDEVAIARRERGLQARTVDGVLRPYSRSEVFRSVVAAMMPGLLAELPAHKRARHATTSTAEAAMAD